MRPTALGYRALLFLGLLWGTYFAVPYTNLFFLGISFLSAWLGLGAWWTWRNLRGVRLRTVGGTGPAGAPVPVTVEVDPCGRTREGLRLRVAIGGTTATVDLGRVVDPGARPIALPALPRGVFAFAATTLESDAPFGLFRARRRLAPAGEVVVHPAPASAADLRAAEVTAGAGDPTHLSGLREFRAGDERRSVHWRGSARRGQLVVREWEPETEREQRTHVDRRCAAEVLERRLALAVAMAQRARLQHEPFRFTTQGAECSVDAGGSGYAELMRLLATLRPLATEDAPA